MVEIYISPARAMKMRFSITMLVLALGSSLAYSQAPQEQQVAPQSSTDPQASAGSAADQVSVPAPLKADPQLLCGKLENGLSYIIRPTSEPKGRASLRLYVDTGSLNESPETKGISHFCEHMVFNGSRHFERGELIPAMQRLGLGFGGDANAYTGLLQTVYMLDLPKMDEETLDFSFTVLRDFADGATFTDEAIDKERGIIISELKSRDSEGYRASKAFIAQLLGGTRVPDYMPIGLEEVVRDCPHETIRRYYHDNYVPERMTVIVTGDFEPSQAKAWVEKYFGDMAKAPNPPRPDIGTLANLGADEKVISNPESALTSVMITIVDPFEQKEDTIERRIGELPLQLALNMLNQRLNILSKKPDAPFNAADASQGDLFRAASTFGISATAPAEQWKQALTAIEQELRRACEYGFDTYELQDCTNALLSAARNSRDSWATTTCTAMANSIIGALDDKLTITAPDEDLRSILAGLERIQANPDLCRQALKEAYQSDRVKLTLLGKVPADANEEALRATFEAAHATKVDPPASQGELKFAYDHIGEAGRVVEKSYIEELDTTTVTLSNGIRVNLKPMEERRNTILIRADIDGGCMNLPPIPGLLQMTARVMDDGALEAHSQDDLRRLTAAHKVGSNFSISADRFVLSGETNRQDLELQCKLIAAGILHAGYRPEGETMLRRSADAFYKRLETTPEGAYQKGRGKGLYGNDPRFTLPEKEELLAVTTHDVQQAVAPFLANGAMEVTLVGDMKVGEVLPILERTFGAMPARNPQFTQLTEAQRTVLFRPWGQRTFLRYDTELDKTIVSQVIPAGDGMNRKRNRRLQVLGSIASEMVFSGIRAALGESYSPRVTLEANEDYPDAAFFVVTSAGVKRNRTKVNSALDLLMQKLGRGEISQNDLDCALRPLRARTEKAMQQPSFWLGALSHLQSDPEQRELLSHVLTDLDSITLEEIQTLSKEIFGSGKVHYFFTVPKDYDETAADSQPVEPAAAPETEPQQAPAAESAEQPEPAAAKKAQQAAAVDVSPYTIIISEASAQDPAWMQVAEELASKYGKKKRQLTSSLS